jgi:uncharacterized membrane protein YbhN (UPF0104 family)
VQQSMSGESQESLNSMSLESIEQDGARSRNFQAILNIIKVPAGLALLILAVRGINYENLINGFRSADLAWLFVAILSVLVGLGLKLWRWELLLKNYQLSVSSSRIFSAYFVGQAANILLPFRGGELVRLGYFAGEKSLLPQAASTIVVEKYLDLLALTMFSILVSFRVALGNILNLRGFLLPITIVVTVLFLIAILFGPALWQIIREKKFMPQRLIPWLDSWVQASQWLRNPTHIFPVVLLSALIWGVMWLTNLLLFRSFGLALGGTAGGLVLVLVYIGLLPALMPGNLGPFYFFASLALLPFGIIQEQALVFAVILHAIVTLPPLLGGALGFFIRSPKPLAA